MSVTSQAASAEIARSPAGSGAVQTTEPSAPTDLVDHPRLDPDAAVGDRREGRGQVEWCHLDRPERSGEAGLQERLPAAGEVDAHRSSRVRDGLVADPLERPDGGDVERVLQGTPDEDRSAVELVGVARRPVLAPVELGRDVEQQAARCQPFGIERRCVQDRLERGTGLACAVTGRVVLRLELAAGQVVARVPGATDVGQHVAGPVVHRDECAVVEVLAAQRTDPRPIGPADLEVLEHPVAGASA